MSTWSLRQLLASLHEDIEQRLAVARKSLAHPTAKGDASVAVWLELLKTYLPGRYQAASAHVVDSNGSFSEQIDIVVHDKQYTPFIFKFEEQLIIPAESVYAAFEAKQTINSTLVTYAQTKIASVRRLYRTSLPIPHAGGVYAPRVPARILGGVLALDSDWNPPLGVSLIRALHTDQSDCQLDLGCIAEHGTFARNNEGVYEAQELNKPATAFLFELISRLQSIATVPMIDIHAYAKWLIDVHPELSAES